MSDPGGLSDADILRGRVLIHLEEIEIQRQSFERVTERLGEAGFVAAWTGVGTPSQIDDKGAAERAYEQIVNDLHGVFECVETRAFNVGLVPDPAPIAAAQVAAASREVWWAAADAAGVQTDGADRSGTPGRWRRLACYGHLDHDLATQLLSMCDARNLLQHGYAHRNRERGVEVWRTMRALVDDLPQVIGGLCDFRDRVAPPETGESVR
jgi:hypothetical protein